MPSLEDVYRKYPPYIATIMNDYELDPIRAQIYQGSMLGTIRSRSFMTSFRKEITESIPCKVSLKCFAMFYNVLKGKIHNYLGVFTEIITPQYEEVLNDQQIDEVIKEHFIIADSYTQQEHPSKFFLGYSGLVISIVPHNPLRGNVHIPLPAVTSNAKQAIINPDNKDTSCLIWHYSFGCYESSSTVSKNPLKIPEKLFVNPQKCSKNTKKKINVDF